MANFGPLADEIGLPVWGTQQILTDFASWLRYCSDVAQRRPTKLCMTFGRLLSWYTIYTFLGAFVLPPDRILPRPKFTLRPSLAFSYIGIVTARHSSSGRQPNFAAWYKEWNYGSLADGATYIRLGGHHVGIGPHSSLRVVYSGCKYYVLMRLICSEPSRKWPPYVIGQSVILSSSGFFFFFLLSFYLFSSPILSRHILDAYHTSTHDVILGRI